MYDEVGDVIFQKIMTLIEYYLTSCEIEILEKNALNIWQSCEFSNEVEILELGCGDGQKTMILLSQLYSKGIKFSYTPIDISTNVLKVIEARVKNTILDCKVRPICSDYFDFLSNNKSTSKQRILLFLGSNIGNLENPDATLFLKKMAQEMQVSDRLLVGFDLIKDPKIVLDAYNDPHGVTGEFNLNLLSRINEELEANFDISNFKHSPVYNHKDNRAESYIVSVDDQAVAINGIDQVIEFKKGEKIFIEISTKYTLESIINLIYQTGLEVVDMFYDSKYYFANVVFKKQ